jgi:hypothetical protein
VEFVRLLLVFLHLVQRRAPAGAPLNQGWLHIAALQLITGLALQLLAPATDQHYNGAKLGIKTLVLLVIGALALVYVIRKVPAPKWLPPSLVGLVVVNVGIAVFWT